MIATKAALRSQMRSTLKELDATYISECSAKIAETVLGFIGKRNAKAVSVYLSMPKEVQTRPILENLFALEGVVVYMPKVVGPDRHDMKMPQVLSLEEIDAFPSCGWSRSKWGIPEIDVETMKLREDGSSSSVPEMLIDFVVTPGVAFDSSCRRLGHGKGYYDTFLTALNQRRSELGLSPVVTIGVALDEQVVDCVPVSEHDVLLDYVVTPTRVFDSQQESAAVAAIQSECN